MYDQLNKEYLTWLYARIGSPRERNPTRSYWSLMHLLFVKEFIWFVPNDDNRVEDGRYLRYEFLEEAGHSENIDPDWRGMGCSVLEMLIGVALRLAFEVDRTPQDCFWELLNNLGLDQFNDREFDERRVSAIIDVLVWRLYDADGRGGLFPLRNPRNDQREVEIWYQMSAYILERD